MDLKSNINRIHSELTSVFENVSIFEKSSLKLGKYFEIEVNEKRKLRMIIPFKNIDEASQFEWMYFANPEDESSLVHRIADCGNIREQVIDIFVKDRFSDDYKNI